MLESFSPLDILPWAAAMGKLRIHQIHGVSAPRQVAVQIFVSRRIMRLERPIVKMIAMCVLALTAVVANGATIPVRGASHYGANSDFGACLAGAVNDACEAFDTSSADIGTVNFNGISYNVEQFVTGFSGVSGTVYDVIDFGNLAAGTTYTLTSENLKASSSDFGAPTTFNPSELSVFTCGDGTGTNTALDGNTFNGAGMNAYDSSGNGIVGDSPGSEVDGPCIAGLTVDPLITESGNSFTTPKNFNLADLVLAAPVVPANTPEPGSLMLFGVGFIAIGAKI